MSLPRAAVRAVCAVLCFLLSCAVAEARGRVVKVVKVGPWSAVFRIRPMPGDAPEMTYLKQVKRGKKSAAYARAVVEIGQTLQANREFFARFGGVIPKMELDGVRFALAEGRGVGLNQVPEALRAVSAAERDAAAAFAEAQFPGYRFSREPSNFLYDPATGRISAWFDLLSDTSAQPPLGIDGPPTDEPSDGWRDHVVEKIGEGNHGEVYLLDRAHGAVSSDLVVLKRYKRVSTDLAVALRQASLLIGVVERLRQSKVLFDHFGTDILPRLAPSGTGKVSMSFLEGVPMAVLRQLHGATSSVVMQAEAQARIALTLAATVLGQDGSVGAVDTYMGVDNFLADPDSGMITGWPDPGLHL